MAPATDSSGATRGAPSFVFGAASQPQHSNEPEVILIDDDDDDNNNEDEYNGQDGVVDNSVDEMDQDSDDAEEIDIDEDDEGEEEGEDEDENDGDDYEDEAEEEEQNELKQQHATESVEKVNGIDSIFGDINRRSLQSSPAIRMPPPSMFTSSGIQEALHPLQRTADRVTRQMQAFAEKLDRFKQQDRSHGPYQAAFSLIKSYQLHASDAIKDASRQSTLRKARLGWSTNREPDHPDPKSEEDLRRLQLEVDTWDLLLNLIAVDDPSAIAHVEASQKSVFQNLHRYSTDREIWDQFLIADNYATECVMVMKWLEAKAKLSSHHLDSLISSLEAQADRGSGLWAHGWLYTKESIKGQKRLRGWPQPLEPSDPGILASLLNPEKNVPLITQLDPDAVIRQKQGLQKQDEFYEQATWLTCWKMIRQGENWTKIQEWSQERLESWRAVSLCGSSTEKQSLGTKTPLDDSMARMMNFKSQDSWRAACSALARNPNTGKYEKAVYALLSGETEPAYRVCKSWDDHLYVFYNHILLSRYRNFCSQFSRKLSHSPLASVPYVCEKMDYGAIEKFLESLRVHEHIGMEARNPYHTIQAVILSKNFDSFFLSIANAASEVSKTSEGMSLVPDIGATGIDKAAIIAVGDKDALRIITHLYIITRSLSNTRSDTHFAESAALIVIAHAENLRQAELTEWIPLYVSFLPSTLIPGIMVKVLIDIVDPRAINRMIKLLEKHEINIGDVRDSLCDYVYRNTPKARKNTITLDHKSVRDLGKKELVLMPVTKRFAGQELSIESDNLIQCLEWYTYLDGSWSTVCKLLGVLYRRFYGNGMLLEARELCVRIGLSESSQRLLGYDIRQRPVDEEPLVDESPVPPSPSKSPSKRSRFRRSQTPDERVEQYMLAETILELEDVVLSYMELEAFQLTWERLELHRNSTDADTAQLDALVEELHSHVEAITEHAESLIDKEYGALTQKSTPEIQAQLEYVRHTYFPDIILNYLCAIYYASLKINRGLLQRSMELAILIAEDGFLIDCFQRGNRIRELADAMTLTAAAMVNAPKPAKSRRQHDGDSRLDIWDIEVENKNGDDA